MEGRQIRLREVAVVVRRLLDPHAVGLAALLGPAPRLLDERLAGTEDGRLPFDLELDRPFHRPERVHVLDLDPGPERFRAARPEGHVGLDPHLAPFHVGVGGTDRAEQQLELLGVAPRLLGGPDLRFGDDLHERGARPVEVDEADLAPVRIHPVDELGRVLLQVCPGDRHGERPIGGVEGEPAARGQRQLVLADLVALGEVRIEVVLAIPARRRGCRCLDRRPGRQDVLDGPLVDDRQRSGQPETDRTGPRVRRSAVVVGRAAAEHLGRRLELAMNLDADDRLVSGERCGRGRRRARRLRGV